MHLCYRRNKYVSEKRDKRSIQSSEWIYDALKELMYVKDYSKITVTDIVNKANIGRTTFYRYFYCSDKRVYRSKLIFIRLLLFYLASAI